MKIEIATGIELQKNFGITKHSFTAHLICNSNNAAAAAVAGAAAIVITFTKTLAKVEG